MAEAKGPSAVSAYKSGVKEGKGAPRKKSNTNYIPIGRTLAVLGGTGQMIRRTKVEGALRAFSKGNLATALGELAGMFDTTTEEWFRGIKTIATGVTMGKVLDKAQANPKVKVWSGVGIKLW